MGVQSVRIRAVPGFERRVSLTCGCPSPYSPWLRPAGSLARNRSRASAGSRAHTARQTPSPGVRGADLPRLFWRPSNTWTRRRKGFARRASHKPLSSTKTARLVSAAMMSFRAKYKKRSPLESKSALSGTRLRLKIYARVQ